MKMSFVLCLFSLLLSSLNVYALKKKNTDYFEKNIQEITKYCDEVSCDQNINKILVYSEFKPKLNVLSQVKNSKFDKIVYNLAQIWGDTILEADYEVEDDVRLDKVFAYYKNKLLIGYHVTYSSKAWNTMDCVYDGHNKAELNSCPSGRIYESAYISSDQKQFLFDDKNRAHFK